MHWNSIAGFCDAETINDIQKAWLSCLFNFLLSNICCITLPPLIPGKTCFVNVLSPQFSPLLWKRLLCLRIVIEYHQIEDKGSTGFIGQNKALPSTVMLDAPSFGKLRLSLEENQLEKKMKFLLFTLFGIVQFLSLASGKSIPKNKVSHKSLKEMKEEIAGYEDVAESLINLAVYGKAKNRSYERLSFFIDTVGPRLSGSKNLDRAIEIMYKNLQQNGLDSVHLEPVKIPHWERGEESAVMLVPRLHKMAILGLGSSIGTPPEGITAEVLVVTSFDELQRRSPEAKGKIVVFNQPFISYAITVQYRIHGAVEAAKVGALASLIRSVASFSVYSPHTGNQEYQDDVPKIPTACITVEDAEMLTRLASYGKTIVIQLKMGAKTYPDTVSFNTVAEITGDKYPDQISSAFGNGFNVDAVKTLVEGVNKVIDLVDKFIPCIIE
ncbi:carboxypeptidase Q [Dipodomys spectabilis]|uniref:carboxypeptidase Q n=1 Tax=Dipodomys spectabilis TaxID=105255 RepID=UPI001C53F3A9|nr:carboxypeptidase Q [Dipodomys spectabilis]